jgi:hypothetical protein
MSLWLLNYWTRDPFYIIFDTSSRYENFMKDNMDYTRHEKSHQDMNLL